MTSDEELLLKLEHEILDAEIAQLKKQIEEKETLPHLYAFKHYKWSRKFFESTNKEIFLCAANQVSKSSIHIRRFIHLATEKSLWKKFWPHLTPNQFWYLYPTKDVATAEFFTKWMQFLPKNKDCPKYGWKHEMDRKLIKALHFNSGVSIYFKTYAQDSVDLQSGTCFMMGLDEEAPVELLGELQSRLNATDGYLSAVFTATIGQDYWRRTIEPNPGEKEEHPNALKLQISLYDCLKYEDGSSSHWNEERIDRIKSRCPTQMDVLIRVYGKFAAAGGRVYESYDPMANRSPNHPLPKTWHIYAGVDIGSGGEKGHPASIVFIAVDPLFRKGRVFKAWRGDGISTTSGDILIKYMEMRGKLSPVLQLYDYSSAEFRQMAEAAGENFERADKSQESSQRILNTLFKHNMLSLQEGDEEIDKLSTELCTLLRTTPKQNAKDDLIDALRYAVTKVPWDFGAMEGMPVIPVNAPKDVSNEDLRRGLVLGEDSDKALVDLEIAEWNDRYGS